MSYPSNPAPTNSPIDPLLAKRWSPRAIGGDALTDDQVHSLFEAARWAPSSSNIQPWKYVYAQKDGSELRRKIEGLLTDGNYWAKNAALLIVAFANTKRVNSEGKKVDNPFAMHDTGAATFSLVLQATSMDLCSHQMAGFDREKANELLGVDADFMPASMIAIGPSVDSSFLNEKHREAEKAERKRRGQEEFVEYKSALQ